jgi:hypothetical protein
MFHSKMKGNVFERKVAKMLGAYFYNEPNALIRTATSGASGTIGDVTICEKVFPDLFEKTRPVREKHPGGRFPFVIENKHHKDVNIAKFIFEDGGFLRGVWDKTEGEALKSNKMPILIVKSNRSPIYMILDLKTVDYLNIDLSQCYPFCRTPSTNIVLDFEKVIDKKEGILL